MAWAQDTKFRLQVFAIGMSVVLPVLLAMMAGDIWRGVASHSWPSVPGTVQNVFTKSNWNTDSRSSTFYGRVLYRYAVEGKEYTSDLTDLGPGTQRSDMNQALADVASYQPGSPVTVYYDPANPSVAIVERGVSTVRLVLFLVVAVGAIVCPIVSFFTIRKWLARRGQAAD